MTNETVSQNKIIIWICQPITVTEENTTIPSQEEVLKLGKTFKDESNLNYQLNNSNYYAIKVHKLRAAIHFGENCIKIFYNILKNPEDNKNFELQVYGDIMVNILKKLIKINDILFLMHLDESLALMVPKLNPNNDRLTIKESPKLITNSYDYQSCTCDEFKLKMPKVLSQPNQQEENQHLANDNSNANNIPVPSTSNNSNSKENVKEKTDEMTNTQSNNNLNKTPVQVPSTSNNSNSKGNETAESEMTNTQSNKNLNKTPVQVPSTSNNSNSNENVKEKTGESEMTNTQICNNNLNNLIEIINDTEEKSSEDDDEEDNKNIQYFNGLKKYKYVDRLRKRPYNYEKNLQKLCEKLSKHNSKRGFAMLKRERFVYGIVKEVVSPKYKKDKCRNYMIKIFDQSNMSILVRLNCPKYEKPNQYGEIPEVNDIIRINHATFQYESKNNNQGVLSTFSHGSYTLFRPTDLLDLKETLNPITTAKSPEFDKTDEKRIKKLREHLKLIEEQKPDSDMLDDALFTPPRSPRGPWTSSDEEDSNDSFTNKNKNQEVEKTVNEKIDNKDKIDNITEKDKESEQDNVSEIETGKESNINSNLIQENLEILEPESEEEEEATTSKSNSQNNSTKKRRRSLSFHENQNATKKIKDSDGCTLN